MRMYVNQALADLATDSASINWAGKLGLPKLLHLWSTEGGYWNGLQCKLERSVELSCISKRLVDILKRCRPFEERVRVETLQTF